MLSQARQLRSAAAGYDSRAGMLSFMPENSVLSSQPRIASSLDKLKKSPPGCILIEGGSEQERKDALLYWAMSLNCPEIPGPCRQCKICIQISGEQFRDLHLFAEGRKVKVEEVRELRTFFSQRPHYAWRIIAVAEAQGLGAPPANALLKSIEEPSPKNSFVLLAPQKEGLFSTLVSRSFILTLGRTVSPEYDEYTEESFKELGEFVRTGKGWLDRTMKKDGLDLSKSLNIISRCRHELVRSMLEPEPDNLFFPTDPQTKFQILGILRKAEESLSYKVRVDLVMEWAAVSLWKKVGK